MMINGKSKFKALFLANVCDYFECYNNVEEILLLTPMFVEGYFLDNIYLFENVFEVDGDFQMFDVALLNDEYEYNEVIEYVYMLRNDKIMLNLLDDVGIDMMLKVNELVSLFCSFLNGIIEREIEEEYCKVKVIENNLRH